MIVVASLFGTNSVCFGLSRTSDSDARMSEQAPSAARADVLQVVEFIYTGVNVTNQYTYGPPGSMAIQLSDSETVYVRMVSSVLDLL